MYLRAEIMITYRCLPALALAAFHIAADFGEFTRHQLAPTMYMEKFSCTPVQMVGYFCTNFCCSCYLLKITDHAPGCYAHMQGSYLAIGNAVHIPAGFVWAAIEASLVKRGVNVLTMRRGFTGVASVMETILQVLYGLAPSPLLATIYYGLIDAFFTMHTGKLKAAAISKLPPLGVPLLLAHPPWCPKHSTGSERCKDNLTANDLLLCLYLRRCLGQLFRSRCRRYGNTECDDQHRRVKLCHCSTVPWFLAAAHYRQLVCSDHVLSGHQGSVR